MYLQIDDRLSVGDVEDRFNECYPSLRIGFYSVPHKLFEATDKQYRYTSDRKIGDIRHKHFNQPYEIKSWFTVARIEKDLKEIYGLNVQVFRCDSKGNIVQTTQSDDLTLSQQQQFALEPSRSQQLH